MLGFSRVMGCMTISQINHASLDHGTSVVYIMALVMVGREHSLHQNTRNVTSTVSGTSTVTVTVIQVIQAKENAAVVASSRTHLLVLCTRYKMDQCGLTWLNFHSMLGFLGTSFGRDCRKNRHHCGPWVWFPKCLQVIQVP